MRTSSVSLRLLTTAAIIALVGIELHAQTTAPTDSANDRMTTRRTLSRYSLILFNFDRAELTPINERVMEEYVYEDITSGSKVDITGFTDIVGNEIRNEVLTRQRADAVATVIRKGVSADHYAALQAKGVGETAPIYHNDLPEERFYNRTVQIVIDSPNGR